MKVSDMVEKRTSRRKDNKLVDLDNGNILVLMYKLFRIKIVFTVWLFQGVFNLFTPSQKSIDKKERIIARKAARRSNSHTDLSHLDL